MIIKKMRQDWEMEVVVFESVNLLSYTVHKTSLKRGKSYIKSPEWVIIKRATINLENNWKLFSENLLAIEMKKTKVKVK